MTSLFDVAKLTTVLHIDKLNWELLSTDNKVTHIAPISRQDLIRLVKLSEQSRTVRLGLKGGQLYFTRDIHARERSVYGAPTKTKRKPRQLMEAQGA